MARGRKKIPDNLHYLYGTDRPCRMNPDQPKPDNIVTPPAPSELNQEGRRAWEHYARVLSDLNILTNADLEVLFCFCVACSTLRAAMKLIDDEGHTTASTRGGLKPHPGVYIQHEAMRQIRSFGSELGLSPASRPNIRTNPPDGPSNRSNRVAAQRLMD